MSDENTADREISPGIAQHGNTGDCGSEGWAVFKWNVDHFELEDGSHCGAGFTPPAPPVPDSSERSQISTYNEFRAIVCCGGSGGSGGSTGSSS